MWQDDSEATNASSGSTPPGRTGRGDDVRARARRHHRAAVERPFVRAAVLALGEVAVGPCGSSGWWRCRCSCHWPHTSAAQIRNTRSPSPKRAHGHDGPMASARRRAARTRRLARPQSRRSRHRRPPPASRRHSGSMLHGMICEADAEEREPAARMIDDRKQPARIEPHSGMLSCFFHGFSSCLLRSLRSPIATRRRVECGMITSSMKPLLAATNGLAKRSSYSAVRSAISSGVLSCGR